MALVVADRVKETTATTGTGTVTLDGAATGYQSFAAVGDGNTTYYTIAGQGTAEWEVGLGTYTSSGTTLSRDTVLSSSNSGSLVNFSAGSKDVFVTFPAERSSALSTVTQTEITATAGQTAFTPTGGYTPGYIEVYLNGLLLTSADYTASDGVTVTLASAAASGDEFMSIAFGNFYIANVFPDQSGHSGEFLTTDGSSVSWAAVDALPSQTGHSGEYLTTDGSTASWATVSSNSTSFGLYEHANTISANYSITSGNNAMSAGPITIDSGVSVTIPSGSRWFIG